MTDANAVVKKKDDNYDLYRLSMWVGSVILGLNCLGLIVWDNLDMLWAGSLMIGLAGFLLNFFAFVGMQKPAMDERTRKIGTAATAYSWYATLIILCLTGVSGYFLGLDIGMARFLGIAILAMVVTMLASNMILGRKGGIEQV